MDNEIKKKMSTEWERYPRIVVKHVNLDDLSKPLELSIDDETRAMIETELGKDLVWRREVLSKATEAVEDLASAFEGNFIPNFLDEDVAFLVQTYALALKTCGYHIEYLQLRPIAIAVAALTKVQEQNQMLSDYLDTLTKKERKKFFAPIFAHYEATTR